MSHKHLLASSIALLAASAAFAQNAPAPWFERSAFLHFAASAELAINGYTLGAAFSKNTGVRLASGAAFSFTLGLAKELYDLSASGEFSWRDMGWNAMGIATGLLISWLVDRLLFAPQHESSASLLAFAIARPLTIPTAFAPTPRDR